MQLPTWGKEFDTLRAQAFRENTRGIIKEYVVARGMGFCENCGAPVAKEVAQMDTARTPRSYISVCGNCSVDYVRLKHKVKWLEDNLDTKTLLYVTAAIMFNQSGEILVCQKPNLWWEFPGGKMSEGEGLALCLKREIKEELDIRLEIVEPFLLVDHDYGRVKLRLFGFTSQFDGAEPTLYDHINYRYVRAGDLPKIDLSPADIAIAKKLNNM